MWPWFQEGTWRFTWVKTGKDMSSG
ncbi:unnamed protein product [Linum tenue]|uniref:Uncharacterized protein n=1 Tax=Linum tenue TaxID=586396 RepID=A0AAV0M7L9_9ROSI|nr:unnamed protein product [Linum tenue]